MEIAKDTFVVLEYTARLEDGTLIRGENGPVSMNFIAGYDQILPGLEHRLLGMKEGDEAEFAVPAREAFGEHDETLVYTRSFEEYPEGRELQAGKWVVATNQETQAQYGFFVKEKTDAAVVLDFNHPLNGKDLFYRVKVVHIRAALPEELEFIRPCEHGSQAEEPEASASPLA